MLLASAFFATTGLAYNFDYELIENWANSKTSCSQNYRNEWACKGYGNQDASPCDWETCKQHCDESEYCLFFFTNENSGCHLYSSCADTRSTGHVGNTWARLVAGTALHTSVMDFTPKALAALQNDDTNLRTASVERPDKVGMWVVISVMILGVLTIAGLLAWKKCSTRWTPFVPNPEAFEAYGANQPNLKHKRLEEESYQNQDPSLDTPEITPIPEHKVVVQMGRTSEVQF